MRTVTDFGISIAVFVVLFAALVSEHVHNTNIIDEQHNVIYQQESKIDDLKYQIGQCRLMVGENYEEYK
jgi:hypothetical protein